jgi:cyclic pyranopterin phosphate synthase
VDCVETWEARRTPKRQLERAIQANAGFDMSNTALLPQVTLLDALERPMRSLRISVTDRCNLRCRYCMPEEEYVWLQRAHILTFEELANLAGIFAELGVERIRLTGGEPLLRHNLSSLVRMLSDNPRIRDLALTTNGVLLARQARGLAEAGLQRITVSLDTLQPGRFRALTRSDTHPSVLEGIHAAREAGFRRIKINAVIIRGFNDDEIPNLIEFGRRTKAEIRFIEYMDVGGATDWSMEKVVPREEILNRVKTRFGPISECRNQHLRGSSERSKAPAERFVLDDGAVFGIIASTTQPFCRSCDRSRLTTDGMWFLCLYAERGIDLKSLLRSGASREDVLQVLRQAWAARADRGAEVRQQLTSRGILIPVEQLRQDPHREMHTRGG